LPHKTPFHSFALQLKRISYVLEADFKCRLFSVQVFQTVDSSINEFIATIYLGFALLASNILTMFLAHKVRLPAAVLVLPLSLFFFSVCASCSL
jgi:hypothetical protein